MSEAAADEEPEPVRLGRAALLHPVSDYADRWSLVMQCAGSCRRKERPVAELPALSPGTTWAEVIPRLRCECGAGPDIVGLSGPAPIPGWAERWLLLRRGEAGWR